MNAIQFITTVFCFCGLLATLISAQAEVGSECQTPDKFSGICVDLRDCNDLLRMLQSRSNEPGVKEFLRSSTCGFVGFNPLVCCRRERPTPPPVNFPTSSTTSTTTTSAPTTASSTPSSSTTTTERYTTTVEASSSVLPGIPTVHPLAGARYSLPRYPYCGIAEAKGEKIVGGRAAQLGEYPWIVALGYRNAKNPKQPKWLCGGSLITEKHALTAAHCSGGRDDLYLIRAGELDLYDNNDGARPIDIEIEKVKIHEEYSRSPIVNDIAIITLKEPARGYLIRPVCLPLDEPLKSKNLVKYTPFASGWGAIQFNGPSSSILQTVQLPIVSEQQCQRAYANFSNAMIDNRVICAGFLEGKMDSCQGDSGGPLVLAQKAGDNSILFYQVGVVSYGFRCAQAGYPGIYTRVTRFIEWIERNLD